MLQKIPKLTPMVRFPNRTGTRCPINSKLHYSKRKDIPYTFKGVDTKRINAYN